MHKKTDEFQPDDEFGVRGEPGQAINEDDLIGDEDADNAEGGDANDEVEDSDPVRT